MRYFLFGGEGTPKRLLYLYKGLTLNSYKGLEPFTVTVFSEVFMNTIGKYKLMNKEINLCNHKLIFLKEKRIFFYLLYQFILTWLELISKKSKISRNKIGMKKVKLD